MELEVAWQLLRSLDISKILRNSKESLCIDGHFSDIRGFTQIWGREKIIPLFYLKIIVKILYVARYFILMPTARWWNLESCLIIWYSKASCFQDSCNFSSLLSLMSLRSVKEKANFYENNQYNFLITRKPNTSRFQRRKFSVPFGVIFCVAKY